MNKILSVLFFTIFPFVAGAVVPDDVLEFASAQLKVAVNAVDSAALSDPSQNKVSPRTVEDGKLVMVPAKDWTSGFFSGGLWYMYEFTQDEYWRKTAERFTEKLEEQKTNAGTHDMGFKMFCSYGQGYRLTGNRKYRDILLESAATLSTRYNPQVGCIRSWDHGKDKWKFPVIIDNMMNLELLFWAFRETGDSLYYDIAVSHARKTALNHFRDDYSSWHVVDYDPETGEIRKKQTHQGYNDDSAWARGQAWGLYGYTMCYRETGLPEFLAQAEHIANYMFSHSVPEDYIFYWDYDAPGIPDEPRDVSAAAVTACALYELSTYFADGSLYKARADKILSSLVTSYRSERGENYGFLLLHSTGARTFERDVPLIYADYYFLEALGRKMRLAKETGFVSENHESCKIVLSDGWEFLKSDLGSVWEAIRPVKKGKPEEVPLWTSVTLPHTYNAEDAVDPDVNYYQGPAWYRILVDIERERAYKGRLYLEFEGAGQKTDVYVHMDKAGSHVGGYDKWRIDITDAVRRFFNSPDSERFKGKVPLSVRCDNGRDVEMIPSSMSDFVLYGGLYRNVNLLYCPNVSLKNVTVKSVPDLKKKNGVMTINCSFDNVSGFWTGDLNVVVKDPDNQVIVDDTVNGIRPYGKLNIGEYILPKPDLWSPKHPSLYTVELVLTTPAGKSSVVVKTGFRQFEFQKNGPFLLNGERLLLRGTHRHEDHAGVGQAMTPEIVRKEMKMIKDMGANFIRLGHYQQSDIVLDLCDSLGILVWEEIPWCRGGLGGERYRSQAMAMLENMIGQHFNHPSVIIWGIGNENDWPGDFPVFEKDSIRAFMSELNALSHRLDPGRKTAIRRCEFCNDIPDIYSPSIWAGWYSGLYRDYAAKLDVERGKVPLLFHAEWGGDSHAGRHSENIPEDLKTADKNGDWSETYIVKLFDWHLKEQEKMPWLTGSAFWTFKDFATPLRPQNPIPYVNQKGVVRRDLTPKESYYVFQSYWSQAPMLHIYGHTWPVRCGKEGETKEILVYSNCDKVELFHNGKSLGVRKRNSEDFPAAGLRWPVVPIKGENVFKAVSPKTGISDEIRFLYQTESWDRPASIEYEVTREGDIVEVHIRLEDKNGLRCLDENDFFRFSLAGDGEMLCNLGTQGGSKKIQASNGRASIKVRTSGGKSVLAVSYPDVNAIFINL